MFLQKLEMNQNVLEQQLSDKVSASQFESLGVRSTATEWSAVAQLGQERSPQPPQQEAKFRLRPAGKCRHQY